MARSADNLSVLLENQMVPLKWAQFIGCRDKDRLPQLAKWFYAMEMSFATYKERIIEFTKLMRLQSSRLGNIENYKWILEPPDLERDEIFYENGISLPSFEATYSNILQTLPLDSILEDSIHKCHRYKREIKELLQNLQQQQGIGTAELPKQISEEEKIEELRSFCFENIKSYKGLVFVHGQLENQLQSMNAELQLPPPTNLEVIFEDTEALKSYEDMFQGHIFYEWTTISNTTVTTLLRISPDIVWYYRLCLEKTRRIITKMQKLREIRQVASDTVYSHGSAYPLESSELADLKRTYNRLFILWKGMRAIHYHLEYILEKNAKEFSMDIEKSEEETYFESEEFVYNIGNRTNLDCPAKWQDLSSVDRYNKVNEDIQSECKAIRETVERMVETLQHKRKTRQTLQSCHQKWKGLVLMHRALTEQEKIMSQTENAFTHPTEEEAHFENENYIMDYVSAHPEAEERHLELYAIFSESALNDTLEQLESACKTLIEGNMQKVQNISFIRKRVAGIEHQHLQTEQSLQNEIKRLEEDKQNLDKAYQELMKGNQNNSEHLIDMHNKEKQQWQDEKQRLVNEWNHVRVEMDEECKTLKQNSAELQEAYRQKQQELDQNNACNALEIEKKNKDIKHLQKSLAEYKQHVKQLETINMMAQQKAQTLETEKEKLLTRLSKIAGTKLTQGNAAITDLSDADRPMKIAEKYSELYDNEWTDALEELLDNGATDDDGIKILLQIVTEAFEVCSNAAQKYQKRMIQSATCLPSLSPVELTPVQSPALNNRQNVRQLQEQSPSESFQDDVQLSDEQKQTLDDLRKALSPQLLHLVQKQYDARLNAMIFQHFGKENCRDESISYHGSGKTGRENYDMNSQVTGGGSGKTGREKYDKNLQVMSGGSGTKMRTKSNEGSLENVADHPSTFNTGMQERSNPCNTLSQRPRKPADDVPEAKSVNALVHTYRTGPNNTNQYANSQYSNIQNAQEGGINEAEEHESKEEAIVVTFSFEKTKEFAKKCVNLCWLMGIKDPPLAMIFDVPKGNQMNPDWFKHYTQSGKLVKFLVWPALFLHKDGALLAKGVAQPMSIAEEQAYA